MGFILLSLGCTSIALSQGRQTGGGGWGVSTPPEFWMGVEHQSCQPPLILRKKFLGGVGPLKLI